MDATKQAQALRDEAAEEERRREESWQRSDTDGFVSQWAHGLTAQLKRREADLLEAGNVATFRGLFDRTTGKRVRAKIVYVEDRFSGFGTVAKWIVLDSSDRAVHWLPAYKSGKQSKIYKTGFEERDEIAPAEAVIAGGGKGLAGAASCVVTVRRTDGGYPQDATPVDVLRAELLRGTRS